MKYFLWVLRIIIGVLFIFSGVVKANDPMGLVYKMNEFFDVLHLNFMEPFSFSFSVTMIVFEIVCGVAVLIGYAFNVFSFLLLLMNLFFTFLTGYALYSGKIKECGCFGACIKISPQATFNKDVILTIISVVLFIYRSRIHTFLPRMLNHVVMVAALVFAAGIEYSALTHLPPNDCLAYGPGNNILKRMAPGPDYKPAVIKSVFIYQKNGVAKEFTQETYPWQDTTWKFVDRKDKIISEAVGEPEIHDFVLNDSDNNDQTKAILTARGYTFFWFVREIDKAHKDNMEKVVALSKKAQSMHIPFYILCSSSRETAMPVLAQWGLGGLPIITLDHTASKTAMRTNPGLMLIKDGTVVQKWSYLDYPSDMNMNSATLEMKK